MAITTRDITLEGFAHPFEVLTFDMELRPNAHGWAKLHLRMTETPDMFQELAHGSALTIGYTTEDGEANILFNGVLEQAALEKNELYYELSLSLTTGSILLDRDAKMAAYQDDSMTYGDVAAHVVSKTEGGALIFAAEDDPATGGILIQYRETDWAFIRRLASHLGEAIIPDWLTGNPALYFGTALAGSEMEIPLDDYSTFTTVLSPRFYEQGGFLAGLRKGDFLYYRINTSEDYPMGTRATIQGISCKVLYKRVWLDGDQVMFTYEWGRAYPVKRQDNELLTGAMLPGTVLETVDERVRLNLDIDAAEPVIFHNWTPVTGNHFYCMPEVGTRAMLYFGSRLEESAKAVENVRENGGDQLRANHFAQGRRIAGEMYSNSIKWKAASAEERSELEQENEALAAYLQQVTGESVQKDSAAGVWYFSGQELYNVLDVGGDDDTDEDYCEKMLDYNNRYFGSQDGKELSVLPASIGLGPRDNSPKIMLEDSAGAIMNHLTMTLQAGGVIAFQGDQINITAPSQVSMIRSGNGPTSTFNISGDFNVLGTNGSMKGTDKTAVNISKSSTVEELGNPEGIEQVALASVIVGKVDDMNEINYTFYNNAQAEGSGKSAVSISKYELDDPCEIEQVALTSIMVGYVDNGYNDKYTFCHP